MENVLGMTAAQILAIPENKAGWLFLNQMKLDEDRKALIMHWHPDKSSDPKATEVSAHINRLYDIAKKAIAAGDELPWGGLVLKSTDGRTFRLRFGKHHKFELGDIYYGATAVAFVISNEYADLFENSDRRLRAIRYPTTKMREEFDRVLPHYKARFETDDKKCVLVLEKTPDVFMLRDILDFCGGTMDPKHVAWIMNCLYNLACFLSHPINNATFNAWTLDTVFVSPEHHSCMLYGGWWYAKSRGSKISVLPARAAALITPTMRAKKEADISLDLTMIKAIGRELLGDVTGMTFVHRTDVPKPMLNFLRAPTSGVAVTDYSTWGGKILPESFGKRRFVPLEVKASDIFK